MSNKDGVDLLDFTDDDDDDGADSVDGARFGVDVIVDSLGGFTGFTIGGEVDFLWVVAFLDARFFAGFPVEEVFVDVG